MDLGMSNRKFASVMFLLLTIIISLALSGLTFFINDKKASIINFPEGFSEYGSDGAGLKNASPVNCSIGKAGGPVSTNSTVGKLGDPIITKPIASPDTLTGAPSGVQYGNVAKTVPVIVASSSSKSSDATTPSSNAQQSSIFDRIFDFIGPNKPEAFSLRY